MRGPIIVGTDGTETSRRAIEEAASIVKGNRLTVVVVFVRFAQHAGIAVLGSGGLGMAAIEDVLDSEEALAEAQSIAILDPASVSWHFEVRAGEPAAELMRIATELGSDTIVVAGRRHGALGGYVHGSVCTHLLHDWPHSLLVVRPKPNQHSRPANGTATAL